MYQLFPLCFFLATQFSFHFLILIDCFSLFQLKYEVRIRNSQPNFMQSNRNSSHFLFFDMILIFFLRKLFLHFQWGHDFRPDYTRLSVLRSEYSDAGLGNVPIMALTATATPKIVTDTKQQLSIPTCKLLVLI